MRSEATALFDGKARLGSEHVDAVKRLIQVNPGMSLYRFATVVGAKLRMPSLGYATLSRFMQAHGLELLPAEQNELGMARAFDALHSVFSPLPSSPLASKPGRVVSFAKHRRASAKVDKAIPRERALRQARLHATGWLSPSMVRRAASAALEAAIAKSLLPPDPAEFDPDAPESWFTPECFAEDVADLFRLALLQYGVDAGFHAMRFDLDKLAALDGAATLFEHLKPGKRGLGQSPSEPAEGGVTATASVNQALSAGTKT
ncbi:hypothetical protein OU995_18450 [Roseateles sp. SL47]|uniref:hypothetical protein n=1 Tax=Roseateles sp. SL47 TaxID=2995138 RepID=UPI00226F8931|nr:hypothetical protein [Roseateles sp. SL47]WAC71553.1 hypothetical protein OU995_18450 [Roseateles sp. SL47]